MSAKNTQSDTSRVIIKNPLLSGVAGTIDDFVNNTILLPAAEIPATTTPTIDECRDPDNRDSTKSVIYGAEPAVLDSDKFSEISLDQSVDVDQTYAAPSQQEYNPLQNLDTFSAPPLDDRQRDDTLFNPLAQATAIKESLSQLPGVASSVFSSFSSILKGGASPNRSEAETFSPPEPAPFSVRSTQDEPIVSTNTYPYLYDQSIQQQQVEAIPAVAPTFYSPTDPIILRPEASLSPSAESQSNNFYRLKERRKLYAPIPGLNANSHSNIPNVSLPPATVSVAAPPPPPSSIEQNPSKPNNSFSLTSFFGAPLIDKIQNTVLPKVPDAPSTSDIGQQPLFDNNPSSEPFYVSTSATPAFYNPGQVTFDQSQTQQPFDHSITSSQHLFDPSASTPFVSTSIYTPPPSIVQNLNNTPQTAAPQLPPTTNNFKLNPFSQSHVEATASKPIENQFFQPTAPPITPSPSPAPSVGQQTPIPSAYLPPSQTNTPIQTPPLPPPIINTAAPPVGQTQSSYRLQGKPLYKKPLNPTPNIYNPSNQSSQQAPQFFNPSTVPAAPNLNIFNPLEFTNQQQSNLPPTSYQNPQQTVYPPPVVSESLPPPPVSVFNPFNPAVSQIDAKIEPTTSFQVGGHQRELSETVNPAVEPPPSLTTPVATSNIPSTSNVNVFNPFTKTQQVASENKIPNKQPETEYSAPKSPFDSFFGVDNTAKPPNSQIFEPNLINRFANNSVQQALPQTTSYHPVNNNLFEATPFDPFQQSQNNNNSNNNVNVNEFESKALDNVSELVENLNLDKENNFIQETKVPAEKEEDIHIEAAKEICPISFFNNNISDQAAPTNTTGTDLQIQDFFNNPPPLSDVQENVQDKNFNFIGTNLLNKRTERIARAANINASGNDETLSAISLIAEPAQSSSAQSEISEYAEQPTQSAELTSPELRQNIQDQPDGVDVFGLMQKEELAEMRNKSNEQTSTPIASTSTNIAYRPVYKHWFYKTVRDSKSIWAPFSFSDSMLLEEAYVSKENEVVTTDGGRFDVHIAERTRTAVYWTAESSEVRRCSWFYKGTDFRLIPYEENVAEQLEEEYREASNTGEWQRRIPLITGETVVFNSPSNMEHYVQSQSPDGWNSTPQSPIERSRAVKRGTDDFSIDDGEPEQVDHLLFMVHGIGSACDLKFRKVEEVVDEFRSIALQLVQSHYRSSCDRGEVGRVEVLPISWHSELHSEESGIDEKLRAITLESIPKLRNFTNDTLLDILFYTSPVFCQQIIDAVAGNLNKCYAKFCERNPNFNGSVSLSGHSLGSLILFDLLQHQRDEVENSENLENSTRIKPPLKRHCSQQINYTIGHAGTGQPYISYPQINFQPKHFFALGSPIGMFVTIRGIDALGLDFKLPTTDHFFNIFHPYDPVAYRIEALVNPELTPLRPVLIPHHKGRKRMHIELKETFSRVGNDIKQKIMQTLKMTMDTVYNYTTLSKNPNDTKAIQQEVNKVIEQQLTLDELETSVNTSSASSEIDAGETDLALGKINGGRRVDYVLQEAPLEIINEYLFALTSHVCYWNSEDATLFIMKEIYSSLSIDADTKVPQPTMTIERPSPASSVKSHPMS